MRRYEFSSRTTTSMSGVCLRFFLVSTVRRTTCCYISLESLRCCLLFVQQSHIGFLLRVIYIFRDQHTNKVSRDHHGLPNNTRAIYYPVHFGAHHSRQRRFVARQGRSFSCVLRRATLQLHCDNFVPVLSNRRKVS
jgi:hypothetical protein